MKSFTVYKTATGQIIKTGYVTEGDISLQAGEGETAIPVPSRPGLDWILNGQVIPLSEKPAGEYIFDYEVKEWVPNITIATEKAIEKRNKLLTDSDWTQIPNGPLSPEAVQQWAVYRQELRDVPEQSGFPMRIIWPVSP